MIDLAKKIIGRAASTMGFGNKKDYNIPPIENLDNYCVGRKSEPISSAEVHDPVLGILESVLPNKEGNYNKYSEIKTFKEGGTRKIYLANWGPGKKQVVIKVDKTPEAPHAKRHVSRGYDTEAELRIAAGLEDAEENHIVALRDYFYSDELKKLGYSGFVTVEDYFPGENLGDYVRVNGTLGRDQMRDLFKDVLKAEKYLVHKKGLLHRDPNPGNILIKRNGKLQGALTDLTNAGPKLNSKESILPTSGSRLLVDPTKFQPYTGEEGFYDESSEARAIAVDMYFAATGIKPFKFEVDSGKATNLFTGESMLDEGGRLDQKKYEACVDMALQYLRGDKSKLKNFLRKGLSIDSKKRYKTIDDLALDFESAVKPTRVEELRNFYDRNEGKVALGITGLSLVTLLAGANIVYLSNKADNAEARAAFAEKTHVIAEWNGNPLSADNNVVKMEFRAYPDKRYQEEYPKKVEYLAVEPGEDIWINVVAKEGPGVKEKNSIPAIPMKIYLEGFEGSMNHLWPGSFDRTSGYGDMHGGGDYSSKIVHIPENFPSGNYAILVDFYARENEKDSSRVYHNDNIFFTEPGKLINRGEIPIVVGNPSKKFKIGQVVLNSMYDALTLVDLEDIPISARGIETRVTIPERDTSWISKSYYRIGIPNATDTSFCNDTLINTVQLEFFDDSTGEFLGYRFFPIQRERYGGEGDYFTWEYANPDTGWSKRLEVYREAILGDSTKIRTINSLTDRYFAEMKTVDSAVSAVSAKASSPYYYASSSNRRKDAKELREISSGLRELEDKILSTPYFPADFKGLQISELIKRRKEDSTNISALEGPTRVETSQRY